MLIVQPLVEKKNYHVYYTLLHKNNFIRTKALVLAQNLRIRKLMFMLSRFLIKFYFAIKNIQIGIEKLNNQT